MDARAPLEICSLKSSSEMLSNARFERAIDYVMLLILDPHSAASLAPLLRFFRGASAFASTGARNFPV